MRGVARRKKKCWKNMKSRWNESDAGLRSLSRRVKTVNGVFC